MIDSLDRGHMLLGALLVLSVVAGILFFIQQVLRYSMVQEGVQAQELILMERLEDEVVEMRSAVMKGNSRDIQWVERGKSGSCRVFGRADGYLRFPVGWYGERLSPSCFPESGYESLGLYYVYGDLLGSPVRYTYLRQELDFEDKREIDDWQTEIDEGQLVVEIVDSGRSYRYKMPQRFHEAEIEVLRSVTDEGFYLLYLQELWLLPMSGSDIEKITGGVDSNGVIVADFVGNDGVYILFLQRSCGEVGCFYVQFYPVLSNQEESESILLVRQEVAWDNYRVLLVDKLKVIVEVEQDKELQLLAVMWDGRTVWGDFYLWGSQANIFCPFQSQKFEPIKDWVLGCQRRFL